MGPIPVVEIEPTSEYNLSTGGECGISLKPGGPDNIISDGILAFIAKWILIVDHGFIFNSMDRDNIFEYVYEIALISRDSLYGLSVG